MLSRLKSVNKFKCMSVLTSLLYFYLFISLLFSPESVCKDFNITGSESIDLLARRVSSLMLGFSALLFLIRNTPPSVVRQAIAFSVGLNMTGFALSGAFGMIHGLLRPSILGVIAIEVFIAVVYFSFCLSDRRRMKGYRGPDHH